MYKTILVKDLIEDGERLVQMLERQRFPIVAAFWYYAPERMTWRLFIVTRAIDRQGPIHTYRRIQRALAEMPGASLSLDDISVVSPSGGEFNELRMEIEGRPRVAPYATPRPPKDAVFEDAYIYRWRLEGQHVS